ncbi:hypothetical protein BV20DRAFT_983891 [Pilatotrama ljubarskyi]|nr:hypothetical protein BV20DRAFT_983891 [Pilatotrama ljubarskyi]
MFAAECCRSEAPTAATANANEAHAEQNSIRLLTSARIKEVPDKPTVRTQNTPAVDDMPKDTLKCAHVTVSPSKTSTPAVPPPIVEHPFHDIRNATYASLSQRNYGLPQATPSKATAALPKKKEAAYRSFVPVYDPKNAANGTSGWTEQRQGDGQWALGQQEQSHFIKLRPRRPARCQAASGLVEVATEREAY